MTGEIIAACLTMIQAKFTLKGVEMTDAIREMFVLTLSPMRDAEGVDAVRSAVMDSPYLPDWADIRTRYAGNLGGGGDESPDETVERHERERAASERIAQEIQERHRREAEELRQRHPEIDTPEACRQFVLSRRSGIGGSRALPQSAPAPPAGHITVETPRKPLSREEQIAWAEEQIKKGAA